MNNNEPLLHFGDDIEETNNKNAQGGQGNPIVFNSKEDAPAEKKPAQQPDSAQPSRPAAQPTPAQPTRPATQPASQQRPQQPAAPKQSATPNKPQKIQNPNEMFGTNEPSMTSR